MGPGSYRRSQMVRRRNRGGSAIAQRDQLGSSNLRYNNYAVLLISSYAGACVSRLPSKVPNVTMKLISLLAAAFLPMGLFAAPVTEDGVADIDAREPADPGFSKREGSFPCDIVGGSKEVNCRAGPSTTAKVVYKLSKGDSYVFDCVKSGECVTINGAKNCGWDYLYMGGQGCYVNGHYTDSSCTLANLGRCTW
ncbi:hypothetical protein VTI74DRAFT_491 [Chaetomium olivicolor]